MSERSDGVRVMMTMWSGEMLRAGSKTVTSADGILLEAGGRTHTHTHGRGHLQ